MLTDPSNSAAPREVELKFQLLPGSRALLEASSAVSGAKAAHHHLVTTYFDTPDCLLDRAGLTLRLRRSGSTRLQTVKSRQTGGSLAADRGEWEWDLDQDAPDLGRLATVPGLADAARAAEGKLAPIFVSDIRRTTQVLHLGEGTIVEVAFDEGQIEADALSLPVCELELELKGGPVGPMYALAAELQAVAPMWLQPDSKAARGWRLRGGQVDAARKARTPAIGRTLSAAEGLRAILDETLGHLIANIGPTLGGDGEGVHQMRAALRRCRAALKLFEPHLDADSVQNLGTRLQGLGQIFGAARDWDVFCEDILPHAIADLPDRHLGHLAAAAEAARAIAQDAVTDTLRGRGFTALIIDLAVWAEAPARHGDGMNRPLAALAPSLLDRAADKVRKRSRHPDRLSAEQFHDLRKSLKKLFADTDYLSGLYDAANPGAYQKRCKALLDILGEANDAVVAGELVRTLDRDAPFDRGVPAALSVWSDERRAKALRGFAPALKTFQDTAPFWHQDN